MSTNSSTQVINDSISSLKIKPMKKHIYNLICITIIAIGLVSCKKTPDINNTNKKSLPTVITGDAENITLNTASLINSVSVADNSNVSARGVCYDTVTNPSLDNLFTLNGDGEGEFTSELDNLLEDTHYYARAYATNEAGTAYGAQVEFSTTSIDFPVIATLDPSDITMSSAVVGGDIISNGNGEIISKGVCWSLNENPSLDNSINFSNEGAGGGAFSSQIDNLSSETTYYAAAYAQNSKGVSYGNSVSFTTKKANATNFTSIYSEDVTCNSAIFKAEVDTVGNFNIVSSGFCWSINNDVNLINNTGIFYADNFSENITSEITSLESGVTYYFKAFVQLDEDTIYSSLSSFTTCMGNAVLVDSIVEYFDEVGDYQDIELEGWTNIAVQGDRKWLGNSFNDEKWAFRSANNSGLDYLETWLITPLVTNIQDKKLSFKSSIAYWAHGSGHPGAVLISTDFLGDNFESATWTEIDITLAQESDGDHTWVESGEYDLSAFSGNAAVAFKYVGSDTESTSFRIDDIVVSEGSGGGGSGTVLPFSELFTENLGSFSTYDALGAQTWEWTFYDDGCAKMSGYDNGQNENEDWLISPELDFSSSTDVTMNFRQAANYVNGEFSFIKVLVSINYSGEGDPNAASWTEVNVPTMPTGDNFDFIDSGSVDLSAYDGEGSVYVAFKYTSSNSIASTWEISQVIIE